MYDFLISLNRKNRSELVQDAWRFENAHQETEDENCNRMEKLRDALHVECKCNGMWLTLAKDILSKNAIDQTVFSTALVQSLIVGRRKEYNILIHGPGDCAKTFLF